MERGTRTELVRWTSFRRRQWVPNEEREYIDNVRDMEFEVDELTTISHLDVLAKKVFLALHDMDIEVYGLRQRLYHIIRMLQSAQEKLNEMGEYGSFDKDEEQKLKYGLRRVEFLINDIKASHLQGNDRLHSLKRPAKDVIQDVPSYKDPEREGRSLVREVEVMMGRVRESMEIVHLLLLDDNHSYYNDRSGKIICILGVDYADKNDLTRHVFNHPRVRQHFDDRIWVDLSQARIVGNGLFAGVCRFSQILEHNVFTLGSDESDQDNRFKMQDLVYELGRVLDHQKSLVVLDDLSNEDSGKWGNMLEPLVSVFDRCKHGSKLLVTSTSTSVEPQTNVRPHFFTLEPLDQNESTALFQRIAFKGIPEVDRNPHMIDIGLEIVNMCANNLHAIKIIAFILSSEPTNQELWQYFHTILLKTEGDSVSCIKSAVDLMQNTYDALTYQQLSLSSYSPDPLLTYCSLFPLDFQFNMLELQQLWEVQGFVDGVPTPKTFDDSFEKLLARGYFFKTTKTDKNGVVICYRFAHALMYGVVAHLASDNYRLLDKPTNKVDAQHVSFVVNSSWEAPSWLYGAKVLKSLLFLPSKSCRFITIHNMNNILANLKSLQALDLAIVNCGSWPDSIWELNQLRYLRLGISFASLPERVTTLKYLRTLDLRHTTIQELPESFHLLWSLRHLYTGGRLIDLPPRFEQLVQLQTLDVFIVGQNNGLGALAKLLNLAGKLKICYKTGHEKKVWPDYNEILSTKNPKLLSHKKLDELSIVWSSLDEEREPAPVVEEKKDVMEFEMLQPPATLISLAVHGWKGVSFPLWAMDQLVFIHIADCRRCQYLPSFSSLRRLESLRLRGLNALEWMEISEDSATEYFPSLKYLILADLPQLRGWTKVEEHDNDCQPQEHENEQYVPQKFFNRLSELRVRGCPKLMSMPLVPNVEILEAADIHEKLLKQLLKAQQSSASTASLASPTLKELHINSVHELESFSITVTSLKVLAIAECTELTNMLTETSNSLKRMNIRACPRLKSISPALLNLSVFEELEIESCEELDLAEMMDAVEKNGDDSLGAARQGLNKLCSLTVKNISKLEPLPRSLGCLRTLKELSLCWLYNMSALPESVGQLTQLSRLVIRYCFNLKKLPKSFPNLKSLKQLEIKECPNLVRRCKKPDGEDCNLFNHIPDVHLG